MGADVACLVRVSNAKGEGTVSLKGGQRVSVVNGVVEPVKDLNLPTFYKTFDTLPIRNREILGSMNQLAPAGSLQQT